MTDVGAHLLEIGVGAVLLVACGEFPAFAMAYYHSAVNDTTLGYGDVVMSESWGFLGPLEATNGLLLFGVSTALIFAVIQRMAEAKFPGSQAMIRRSRTPFDGGPPDAGRRSDRCGRGHPTRPASRIKCCPGHGHAFCCA